MPSDIGSMIATMAPMIILLVAMVCMTVIPQRKKQKELKAMMDSMKKGDYVKTIGGIHGKIVSIKDEIVVIETGGNIKSQITFAKGAIATVGDADVEADAISEAETNAALKEGKK
ncbi:MAG: preprotein translocase subunit YajC [Clostridiales bacterium]|nr:preprotein translocase subunit YajC [Clostridiales bacterium]